MLTSIRSHSELSYKLVFARGNFNDFTGMAFEK
jgi:hypothetical protein